MFPIQWEHDHFSPEENSWGMNWTTQTQLTPRLHTSGTIPPSLHMPPSCTQRQPSLYCFHIWHEAIQWKFILLSCIINRNRFNTAPCWQLKYTIGDPDSPLPSDHNTGLPQVSSDNMKTNPKYHGKSDWSSVRIKGLSAVTMKLWVCAETPCALKLVPKLYMNVPSQSHW